MRKNDFTEEELEQLLEWGMRDIKCSGYDDNPSLIAKLENMIKHYCEHDWIDTGSDGAIWRCKGCNIDGTGNEE